MGNNRTKGSCCFASYSSFFNFQEHCFDVGFPLSAFGDAFSAAFPVAFAFQWPARQPASQSFMCSDDANAATGIEMQDQEDDSHGLRGIPMHCALIKISFPWVVRRPHKPTQALLPRCLRGAPAENKNSLSYFNTLQWSDNAGNELRAASGAVVAKNPANCRPLSHLIGLCLVKHKYPWTRSHGRVGAT